MENKIVPLEYYLLREKIHNILSNYFCGQFHCVQNNEFDYEWLESQTDEILRLIKQQGGTY